MTRKVHIITKILLSLLMLFSAGMYIFNYAEISQSVQNLGYPTYIIYPLAILKLAGVATIWFSTNKSLTEWAYAGFFFNFILAVSAHIVANDGEFAPAVLAIILWAITYYTYKKQ
ncbi:DoxX family protein [Tenacibaculum sp. UWU-22]|uniref:DoxX family protein n=1 Tax=Tenacibaculum sp. UWU-22 TaxID=3234187 RepID=UPI0034DB1E2D